MCCIRDREASEKDPLKCLEGGESPTEEMWGHGEAMAMEEELSANLAEIDKTPGNFVLFCLLSLFLCCFGFV